MIQVGKVRIVDPDSCTGCRLCQMACSLFWEGISSPARAHISVRLNYVRDRKPLFEVSLREGCRDCRICSEACAYGVIEFTTGQGRASA